MRRASYIIAGYVNRNRDELQRSHDYVVILNYNKDTIVKKSNQRNVIFTFSNATRYSFYKL